MGATGGTWAAGRVACKASMWIWSSRARTCMDTRLSPSVPLSPASLHQVCTPACGFACDLLMSHLSTTSFPTLSSNPVADAGPISYNLFAQHLQLLPHVLLSLLALNAHRPTPLSPWWMWLASVIFLRQLLVSEAATADFRPLFWSCQADLDALLGGDIQRLVVVNGDLGPSC